MELLLFFFLHARVYELHEKFFLKSSHFPWFLCTQTTAQYLRKQLRTYLKNSSNGIDSERRVIELPWVLKITGRVRKGLTSLYGA